MQGWRKRIYETFYILNNFLLYHKPVRVFSCVRVAWQFTLPVGGYKAEIIPPFIIP